MILVILNVNGTLYIKKCKDKKEARSQVKKWKERAKESFPFGKFKPIYYEVMKKG
ncbi:MAG: hypothetical protein WCS86_02480 [Candidatus Paceibacterota bacterium]